MIDEVVKLIKANDKFLLASHVNPDGDALGSALALSFALQRSNFVGEPARINDANKKSFL